MNAIEMIEKYGMNTLEIYMDPAIREDVHHQFTGDSDLEFLLEYMEFHLSRHGEDFDETYIP